MKKIILILALIISLVLAGCTKQIVCNSPYIPKGLDCCLDINDNKICDSDEKAIEQKQEEPKVEEQKTEEIEEKPKEETIEKPIEQERKIQTEDIDLEELRRKIIDIYGEKREWVEEKDKINPEITYYSYYPYISRYKEFVVIADIKDNVESYDEFLDFSETEFNYGYDKSEAKDFENQSLWEKQWGITREWNTSFGKVIEFGSYNRRKDDYTYVHNSFNIRCSPTKLVRIYPNWLQGFGSIYLGINYDKELNTINQFNFNGENILPRAVKIMDVCPYLKNKIEDKRIPEIEKFINEDFGTDYAFLKEDDEYDSKIKLHIPKINPKLIIEKLDYELKEGDFSDFVTQRIEANVKIMDREDRKISEGGKLSDYGEGSSTCRYSEHSVSREVNKEEVNKLNGNYNILELVYNVWDNYNATFNCVKGNTEKDRWERYILLHKISILCKPDLVIGFLGETEYPFDNNRVFGANIKKQINDHFDRQIVENKESLLIYAKEIKDYCENELK